MPLELHHPPPPTSPPMFAVSLRQGAENNRERGSQVNNWKDEQMKDFRGMLLSLDTTPQHHSLLIFSETVWPSLSHTSLHPCARPRVFLIHFLKERNVAHTKINIALLDQTMHHSDSSSEAAVVLTRGWNSLALQSVCHSALCLSYTAQSRNMHDSDLITLFLKRKAQTPRAGITFTLSHMGRMRYDFWDPLSYTFWRCFC